MVDIAGEKASEIGTAILGKLVSGTLVVLLICVLAGFIIGLALYIRYMRQFNIKVRIKTKMGSGADGLPIYKIFYDKGAIVKKGREKRTCLKLRGERVELPEPPFEVRQILDKGGSEIGITRESANQYYYDLPSVIEKKFIIKDGQYVQVNEQKTNIIDSGVDYWGILKKRDNRKLFDFENFWMKILVFLPLAIVAISLVFMLYIVFDKLPTSIEAMSGLATELGEVAQRLENIYQIKSTTGG